MKRISIAGLALGMFLLGSLATPSFAETLWYTGDYQTAPYSTPNQISPSITAFNYEAFIVPDSGWTINTLYSNNFFSSNQYQSTVTEGYWEIRQGVSAGNSGNILLSDTNSVSLSPTGRVWADSPDNPEMRVEVTNLQLFLSAGTYWLSVTPKISNDGDYASTSYSNGENSINFTKLGEGFFSYHDPSIDLDYVNVQDGIGFPVSFSMGIEGTAGSPVPIPPSILLLASALLGLGARGFWVRQR